MGAKVAGSAVVACAALLGCTTSASTSTLPDAQLADASPSVTTSTTSTSAATAATPATPAEPTSTAAMAPPSKPGLVDAHGSAPVDKIIAAFGVRAKAVAACARHVPDAPLLLRVRTVIDPQGRATTIVTDPRVPLPAATQSCVESVLRSRPFPLATPEGLTVTYVFDFSDR